MEQFPDIENNKITQAFKFLLLSTPTGAGPHAPLRAYTNLLRQRQVKSEADQDGRGDWDEIRGARKIFKMDGCNLQ